MSVCANGTRWAAAPWGLVGALALALVVEYGIHRHRLDLMHEIVLGFSYAGRSMEKPPRYEILCLGDSLVKHGVVPRVLEERLGRKSLNAACMGGVTPLTYYLLKRSIDRGTRPSALLIDAFATQLQANPFEAGTQQSRTLNARCSTWSCRMRPSRICREGRALEPEAR